MGSQRSRCLALSPGAAEPRVMEMLPVQNKISLAEIRNCSLLYDQSSESSSTQAFSVKKGVLDADSALLCLKFK